MEKTTRKRILEHLARYPSSSVLEISSSLELTKPAVLYHLQQLISEHEVSVSESPHLQKSKRGRPTLLYRLTPRRAGYPNDTLTEILLKEFLDHKIREGYSRTDGLLHLATIFTAEIDISGSLTARLNRVIEYLNKVGYQSRWEARQEGPQIFFHACPYLHLLGKYPDFCKMDARILEICLGVKTQYIAPLSTGIQKPCIFVLESII